MVLYPNKLPESERVCSGICRHFPFRAELPLQAVSIVSFPVSYLYDLKFVRSQTETLAVNGTVLPVHLQFG